MKKEKNKKEKKAKQSYPKVQFIFNVVSLCVLIGICLYIGGRSIYYYSIQNKKTREEAHTLTTILKENNAVVESGDGLYKVNGEYIFKGKDVNNYIQYSNRLWRVVRIMEDNAIVLVADDNQTILIWGDEASYETSNLYKWLNKQEDVEHTGIFYNSLHDPLSYLTFTPWCEGRLENNKITCEKENTDDYISILTTNDYINSKAEDSYLNDGKYTWLLGLDEEENNIYLNKTGMISKASSEEGYGVRPVITLKANIDVLGGDGTLDSPYKIEKEEELGYINRYVKLGDDLWRVYEEDDTMLHLVLDHYLQVNSNEVEYQYSNKTTVFDLADRDHIAYYLNNRYLASLSYQESLNECTFYTGEISDEAGYNYLNIYQDQITAKVGLFNMVSLKLNQELTDYYLMNRTSSLGDMAMVHNTSGILNEGSSKEKKKIVPVVCISKDKIVSGIGSSETPYVLE